MPGPLLELLEFLELVKQTEKKDLLIRFTITVDLYEDIPHPLRPEVETKLFYGIDSVFLLEEIIKRVGIKKIRKVERGVFRYYNHYGNDNYSRRLTTVNYWANDHREHLAYHFRNDIGTDV